MLYKILIKLCCKCQSKLCTKVKTLIKCLQNIIYKEILNLKINNLPLKKASEWLFMLM